MSAGAAHVAGGAFAHLVHHVAEAHLGIDVDDRERAAPASPEAGAWVRYGQHLARQPESHPELERERQVEVEAFVLHVEDPCDTLLRQECDTVGRAAACGRRVAEGHRAGVAVAAGCRDLGAPPVLAPGELGADGGVGERAHRDRGGIDVGGREGCRRRDHPGDARVALRWRTDVEVGAERAGDLLGEERAERATVDALDDLAEQVALADRVVARLCARLPPWCLRGVQGHELVVVEEVEHRERFVPSRAGRRCGSARGAWRSVPCRWRRTRASRWRSVRRDRVRPGRRASDSTVPPSSWWSTTR